MKILTWNPLLIDISHGILSILSTDAIIANESRMVAPPSYNTALTELTQDPDAMKGLPRSPTGGTMLQS